MTRRTGAWIATLAIGTLVLAPASAAAELHVEYRASRLSVTAADVSLPEVLRAVGAQVGFTVSDAGGVSQPVTVSVQDASVDDVLRQLLRTQNHTILYRASASVEVVDRIVLLGLPGQGGSPVVASAPPASAASRPPAAVSGGAPTPASAAGDGAPADADQPTVGNMLRSHAVAGAPPEISPQPAEQSAAPPPAPSGSLQESLGIATRRAQEGLSSLVEGLERATQALQGAPAAPPPGR
jgi:hypothetical protein